MKLDQLSDVAILRHELELVVFCASYVKHVEATLLDVVVRITRMLLPIESKHPGRELRYGANRFELLKSIQCVTNTLHSSGITLRNATKHFVSNQWRDGDCNVLVGKQ